MSRMHRIVAGLAFSAAAAGAADNLEETRLRYDYASTRAAANFRVADHLAERLAEQDLTKRPSLMAMRSRIELALENASGLLAKQDAAGAHEQLLRAEAWLDRLAKAIGGS